MPMRGLTIIVAGGDPARFGTALTLAAAQAALGGRATVFVDGGAVVLLAPTPEADDAPGRRNLIETALDIGVRIVACQSGLALAGLSLAALDPRIEGGGLVSIMAALGDDRLTIA